MSKFLHKYADDNQGNNYTDDTRAKTSKFLKLKWKQWLI